MYLNEMDMRSEESMKEKKQFSKSEADSESVGKGFEILGIGVIVSLIIGCGDIIKIVVFLCFFAVANQFLN